MFRIGSSKCRSVITLCILAAGGVVGSAPSASHGAVIESEPLDVVVGFGASDASSYQIGLPGTTASLTISRTTGGSNPAHWFVSLSGINAEIKVLTDMTLDFAERSGDSTSWGDLVGSTATEGYLGYRQGPYVSFFGTPEGAIEGVAGFGGPVGPASFSNAYVLFRFQNSDSGNAWNYGWMRLSSEEIHRENEATPRITLHEWAYDDSGAQMSTPIPEPSVLAIGVVMGGLIAFRRTPRLTCCDRTERAMRRRSASS